jgi:hypothetical protein
VPVVARNVTTTGGGSAAVGRDERIVRVPDAQGLDPPPGAVVDVVAAARDGAAGGLASVVVAGAIVVDDDPADAGTAIDGTKGSTNGVTSDTVSDAANSVALIIPASDVTRLASALAAGTIVLALAPAEDACCRATP